MENDKDLNDMLQELISVRNQRDAFSLLTKPIEWKYQHFTETHNDECLQNLAACPWNSEWEWPVDFLVRSYVHSTNEYFQSIFVALVDKFLLVLRQKIKNKEEPYLSIAESYFSRVNRGKDEDLTSKVSHELSSMILGEELTKQMEKND